MLLTLKTRFISLVLPTVFQQHLLSCCLRRIKSALLAILSVAGLLTFSAAFAQPVALTNARIIDGTGAAVVFPGTLIMDQGRIVAVGASTDVQIPEGADIISLDGKTLMPGLINAHGHAGGVRGLETGHYSE